MKFKQMALAALIAGAVSVSAQAADGTLGSTSFADFEIELNLDGQIILKGLDKITLPTPTDRTTELTGKDTICVASNMATSYQVTATSTGGFSLVGPGDTAAYTVRYGGTADASYDASTNLVSGAKSTVGFTPLAGTDCNASTDANAVVWVKVAASEIPEKDGAYTDVVTLTVEPS